MHPRGGLGSTAPPGSGVCRSSASAAGWYGKMTPIGLLLGLLCCVGPTLQVLVVTAGSQEHPRSSTEPVPATPVVHENSSGNKRQLKKMLEVVEKFSDTIKMEFGLDKCAAVHVRKGKVVEGAEVLELLNGEVIDSLEEGGSYKYLGMQQLLQINSNDVRKLVEKKVLARVRKLLCTVLES
ncbi:Hypothetical predicted protein [Cloeon dipterum]|uniref:Uncharacterized protein n=1 Tax=Cloeon dipterum TaxID=197152 RepID=A0A8S1DRR1_9INSE|nr:Hypothetical predicted protein [Cloeon dipterum]